MVPIFGSWYPAILLTCLIILIIYLLIIPILCMEIIILSASNTQTYSKIAEFQQANLNFNPDT